MDAVLERWSDGLPDRQTTHIPIVSSGRLRYYASTPLRSISLARLKNGRSGSSVRCPNLAPRLGHHEVRVRHVIPC